MTPEESLRVCCVELALQHGDYRRSHRLGLIACAREIESYVTGNVIEAPTEDQWRAVDMRIGAVESSMFDWHRELGSQIAAIADRIPTAQ